MTSLKTMYRSIVSLYLIMSNPLLAKGLDSLQAQPSAPAVETQGGESKPTPDAAVAPAGSPQPTQQASPGTTTAPPSPAAATNAAVTSSASPVPPGLQKVYLASSMAWVNQTGSKGSWHTSTAADVEVAYKIAQIISKIDTFASFRYRPITADISKDNRSYRGITEAYLFGVKGHLPINPKLTSFASAEAGVVQTHINSLDSLPEVDKSLEKSGVDLSIGGGVSYLVLDKLGVGSRLALGTGTYKTLQLGVDLRFLF